MIDVFDKRHTFTPHSILRATWWPRTPRTSSRRCRPGPTRAWRSAPPRRRGCWPGYWTRRWGSLLLVVAVRSRRQQQEQQQQQQQQREGEEQEQGPRGGAGCGVTDWAPNQRRNVSRKSIRSTCFRKLDRSNYQASLASTNASRKATNMVWAVGFAAAAVASCMCRRAAAPSFGWTKNRLSSRANVSKGQKPQGMGSSWLLRPTFFKPRHRPCPGPT